MVAEPFPSPALREQGVETVNHLDVPRAAQVALLVAAAAAVDGHEALGEHKWLHATRAPDDHEFGARLFWDAEREMLCAYCHWLSYPEQKRRAVELVVHPEWRRRGLGSRMLQEVLAEARAAGFGRLDVWAYNAGRPAAILAERFAFVAGRTVLQMRAASLAAPDPALPADVRLRPFDIDRDVASWLAFNREAFAEHPENGAWTEADLRNRLAETWFDAGDFQLAEQDGQLVGCIWVKVAADSQGRRIGEIYILGVSPRYEGRGLGRSLALAGLRRMRERGCVDGYVYLDADNTPALKVYLSAGFVDYQRHICYTRSL